MFSAPLKIYLKRVITLNLRVFQLMFKEIGIRGFPVTNDLCKLNHETTWLTAGPL
jgi:hypothetical protein